MVEIVVEASADYEPVCVEMDLHSTDAAHGIVFHNEATSVPFPATPFSSSSVNKDKDIDAYLKKVSKIYQKDKELKIVMAGLANSVYNGVSLMASTLWKCYDILPVLLCDQSKLQMPIISTECLTNAAVPGVMKVQMGDYREVLVDGAGRYSIATLDDYRPFSSANDWERILTLAPQMRRTKQKIVFVNSTAQGGGVALMRHSLIRFCKLLGVDVHWVVMSPDASVFEITKKKFHNVLQGVAPKDIHLSQEDKEKWTKWCEFNIDTHWADSDSPLATATLVVIDDPQPSAIIPKLKTLNPTAKIVYRSHIEVRADLIRDGNSEQSNVWNFLWENIKLCDLFVAHPVDNFVPDNVNIPTVMFPACTDPVDGLNKPLDAFSLQFYQKLFNKFAFDQRGHCVDFCRPYFVQVARFDPSKGVDLLIKSYCQFRRIVSDSLPIDKTPQLVITGHGAIDDPEGNIIHQKVVDIVREDPEVIPFANDIVIVRLGPSDQMLNSILAGSMVAFQLSTREGFEIKVTEALLKGKPVVAFQTGGIPLQITHGYDGYLIPVGDTEQVAATMKKFVETPELLSEFSRNAQNMSRHSLLTPANALRWMEICPMDP